MKPFEKNKQLSLQTLIILALIIYLASILLTQTTPTPITLLLILIPAILLAAATIINQHLLQITALCLFYLLSIPQYILSGMQDVLAIIITLVFFIIPLLLLTYLLLTKNNPLTIQDLFQAKTPLIITAVLTTAIFVLFYVLTIQLWDGYLLSGEQIEGQIILLAALSITLTAPFFIKQKRTNPTS